MMASRAGWFSVLLFTAGVFTLNFILPSDLNNWSTELNFSLSALQDDSVLREETSWRYTDSEFGRRPLMINLLRYTTAWTGWSYNLAFLWWQLVAYLLNLWVLNWLARLVWRRVWPPLSVILVFATSFPNVFLFVAHAHTYDDLFQYAAILLSIGYCLGGRLLPACLAIMASCVIRETSVLFLPVYALLLHHTLPPSKRRVGWLVPGLAVALAGAILYVYASSLLVASAEFTVRNRVYAWQENLSSWARISEALWLPVLILLPGWLLLRSHAPLIGRHTATVPAAAAVLRYSYLPLCIINTLLVWFLAKANEPRLFILPLLLVLPLTPPVVARWLSQPRLLLAGWSVPDWCTTLLAVLLVQLLYQPSVGGTGYAFRAYVVIWTVAVVTRWRSTPVDLSRSSG